MTKILTYILVVTVIGRRDQISALNWALRFLSFKARRPFTVTTSMWWKILSTDIFLNVTTNIFSLKVLKWPKQSAFKEYTSDAWYAGWSINLKKNFILAMTQFLNYKSSGKVMAGRKFKCNEAKGNMMIFQSILIAMLS